MLAMASIVDDSMNDDVNDECALFPFSAENEEYADPYHSRGLHGTVKVEPEAPQSKEHDNNIDKALKAIDMLATNVKLVSSFEVGAHQKSQKFRSGPFTPQSSQHSANNNHAFAAVEHELESDADGEPGSIQEAFDRANRNIKENEQRKVAKQHLTFTASPKH